MRLVHFLQHWLSGTGTRLHVTDFVPESHPIRQWAETFPWAALVSAIEHSIQKRFPTTFHCGRRPVPIRVLLALELLKHELGASDEDICHRFRTDFAVMYACMPEASETIRSIPLKPTLCYPRRSASFAAALTRPSWMSGRVPPACG
jgi:hypothetical protein